MDLKKQYELLMRNELKALGCNKQFTYEQLKKKDRRDNSFKGGNDYELSLLSKLFYSVVYRLFKQKPRQVVKYQGFDDKGNSSGIQNLERKIANGESLVPHLSKYIFDIDQARHNDPMLYEWSIYHFHIPPSDGNGSFVTRSKDLLFAIVTDEQFIFLDVQPHSDNTGTYEPWIDISIIEKIESNYPDLIQPYYLGEGRTPLTNEQRKNLRAKNCNTNIITNSGKEYRIPGCGSVSAGLPGNSIMQGDMATSFINGILNNASSNSVTLSFDENYRLVASA